MLGNYDIWFVAACYPNWTLRVMQRHDNSSIVLWCFELGDRKQVSILYKPRPHRHCWTGNRFDMYAVAETMSRRQSLKLVWLRETDVQYEFVDSVLIGC